MRRYVTFDADTLEQLRVHVGCDALGEVDGLGGGLALVLASTEAEEELLQRASVCGPVILRTLGELPGPSPLARPAADALLVAVLSGEGRRVVLVGNGPLTLVALFSGRDIAEPIQRLKRAVARPAPPSSPARPSDTERR